MGSCQQDLLRFLFFCFSGDSASYSQNLRWPVWQQEVRTLNGNEGLFCSPFLFTMEGKNVARDKRSAVPIAGVWRFAQDMRQPLTK